MLLEDITINISKQICSYMWCLEQMLQYLHYSEHIRIGDNSVWKYLRVLFRHEKSYKLTEIWD